MTCDRCSSPAAWRSPNLCEACYMDLLVASEPYDEAVPPVVYARICAAKSVYGVRAAFRVVQ